MSKHLSTVVVVLDVDKSLRTFSDIKKLKATEIDVEAMNSEVQRRVHWFISGIAMQPPATIISVSHSIF